MIFHIHILMRTHLQISTQGWVTLINSIPLYQINTNCVTTYNTQVGIAGVPADTIMKRTKAIEDNWIPSWNEEFEFPLTVPELALLRIEVHEYDMSEKDDFGGQTCLPISELRKGIRAVPLYSQKGEKYKSVKLLMHFDMVQFVLCVSAFLVFVACHVDEVLLGVYVVCYLLKLIVC